MKFVDGKAAPAALERASQVPGFRFIPVYGLKAVGKPRLVQEFIRGNKAMPNESISMGTISPAAPGEAQGRAANVAH
ncbi:MAG: hypothetical protein K9N21_00320 [Deltaproteobacteria bacterium]|nr:hypothetical protein [Deltaproteobacteria bacterium]